jgi:hypothetical protein
MEKNRANHYEAEEYNDEYNPGEDYDVQGEYDSLEEKWYAIEDEYRERYSDVTDDDVYYEGSRFDDMLANLGRRRGKTRHEIRTEIENW